MNKNTKRALGIGALVLATNLSAFSTVAMQKHIMDYSKEKAALTNYIGSNFTGAKPGIEDIGLNLGHRVFYGDDNFVGTAKGQLSYLGSNDPIIDGVEKLRGIARRYNPINLLRN